MRGRSVQTPEAVRTWRGGKETDVVPLVKDRVDQLFHSPVFEDTSDRRRTWLAWTVIGLAVACCGYVAVLAIGLLGGPVRPGDLLPWAHKPSASRDTTPSPRPGASAPASVQPTGAPGSQVSGSGPASPGTVGAAETSVP